MFDTGTSAWARSCQVRVLGDRQALSACRENRTSGCVGVLCLLPVFQNKWTRGREILVNACSRRRRKCTASTSAVQAQRTSPPSPLLALVQSSWRSVKKNSSTLKSCCRVGWVLFTALAGGFSGAALWLRPSGGCIVTVSCCLVCLLLWQVVQQRNYPAHLGTWRSNSNDVCKDVTLHSPLPTTRASTLAARYQPRFENQRLAPTVFELQPSLRKAITRLRVLFNRNPYLKHNPSWYVKTCSAALCRLKLPLRCSA